MRPESIYEHNDPALRATFSHLFQEQAHILFLTVLWEIYQAGAVQRVEAERVGLYTPGVLRYPRLVETPHSHRVTRGLCRPVQERDYIAV